MKAQSWRCALKKGSMSLDSLSSDFQNLVAEVVNNGAMNTRHS